MARIGVIVVDQTPLFHLSVPGEVFGTDRSDGTPRHEVVVIAGEPGRLRSDGVVLETEHDLETALGCDLVVVPWWRHHHDERPPERLLDVLRTAHARGIPIAGLCGGTFVLAAAGLLDGRRATTHWLHTDKLARQFPLIDVDPAVLYVDEGDVLTSAGTAAAIDLCLHLVRSLSGAEAANTVARRLVVAPHRAGGQAQFIDAPLPRVVEDDSIARSQQWAIEHLDEPLGVDDLARRAHMARRTFARRFREATGETPLKWLLGQRTLLAQRLLETTDLSVDAVAHRSGFGSSVALRAQFQKVLCTSPKAYRESFRADALPV